MPGGRGLGLGYGRSNASECDEQPFAEHVSHLWSGAANVFVVDPIGDANA
jgi:hypothetical protein